MKPGLVSQGTVHLWVITVLKTETSHPCTVFLLKKVKGENGLTAKNRQNAASMSSVSESRV
jgi:hypothetical protein